MEEEILTKEELAKHLKVSPKTIDRLRKKGLPYFLVGNMARFKKLEVITWLENRTKR